MGMRVDLLHLQYRRRHVSSCSMSGAFNALYCTGHAGRSPTLTVQTKACYIPVTCQLPPIPRTVQGMRVGILHLQTIRHVFSCSLLGASNSPYCTGHAGRGLLHLQYRLRHVFSCKMPAASNSPYCTGLLHLQTMACYLPVTCHLPPMPHIVRFICMS
jgi:hypothetical protein